MFLLHLEQTSLTDANHWINWAFVVALLSSAATLATKWVIPGLVKIVENFTGGRRDEDELIEIRQSISEGATNTAQALDLMRRQEELMETMANILRDVSGRTSAIQDSLTEHRETMEEPPQPKPQPTKRRRKR